MEKSADVCRNHILQRRLCTNHPAMLAEESVKDIGELISVKPLYLHFEYNNFEASGMFF